MSLRMQLNTSVQLLEEWLDAACCNGASQDDWDRHYENAAYRINCTRELIDAVSPPGSEWDNTVTKGYWNG